MEVVYVLVELRKLMERNGDFAKYPALKFYCDWAAHPSLDREPAQQIVQLFDGYEQILHEGDVGAGRHAQEEDQELLAELRGTLELTNFHRELGQYLGAHVLDEAPFETLGEWITFLMHYAAVIQDCPLKCSGRGLPFVEEVVASVVSLKDDEDGDFSGGFGIEWRWVSKRTGETRTYTLLLPPEGHMIPIT
jgi:hypothetical protein